MLKVENYHLLGHDQSATRNSSIANGIGLQTVCANIQGKENEGEY